MIKNTLKIKILSLGGHGANILERLSGFEKQGVERIAVGINSKVFSRVQVKNKIELRKEQNLNKTDNLKELVEGIIDEKQDDIKKAIKGADALFIIGSLANDTSHYQIAKITQIAKENKILTFLIASTPFPFEGQNKIKLFNKNKIYLEEYVDAILSLESEKVITEKISAIEAMTKVDKILSDMVNSIIDLVIKFGVVNVDFADLKSTIQNAGEIFFNSVSGNKHDIDTLISELFEKNNLSNSDTKLSKILYVIYAGKDLLMDEVSFIGDKLQQHFDNQARIIFGVVNEEKMKNKLKIVLLGS